MRPDLSSFGTGREAGATPGCPVARELMRFPEAVRLVAGLALAGERAAGKRLGPGPVLRLTAALRLGEAEARQAVALLGYVFRPGRGYADFALPHGGGAVGPWCGELTDHERAALRVHALVDHELLAERPA